MLIIFILMLVTRFLVFPILSIWGLFAGLEHYLYYSRVYTNLKEEIGQEPRKPLDTEFALKQNGLSLKGKCQNLYENNLT